MRVGNVLRVFWRDVKRIAKVPPAWLVVVFLIVLPSIYTWFNVIGFWNPYENTGNMRVCVVNEDKSVEDETLGRLDLGAQIIGELENNDQLGWSFVDREEAMREVESGEAYAAIVIPEDFSADMTTILSGDFQRPQIEYYVNEKLGPVAPKITDTGATTLDTTVNDAFVSTVSATVASTIDEKLAESKGDLETAKGSAVSKLEQGSAGVADAREALSNLATSADEAIGKVDLAKQSLSDAKNAAVLLSSGLGQASAITGEVNTGLVTFSTSMGTVLDHGSTLLSQTSSQTNSAIGQTANGIVAAAGSVDAALERGQAVVQENAQIIGVLRTLQQSLPDGEGKQAIGNVISDLETKNAQSQQTLDGLATLSSDTSALATSVSDASGSVDTAVQQTLGAVDGYRSTLSTTTIPAISSGLGDMGTAANGLSTTVSNQVLLIDQTSAVLDDLKTTLGLSADALRQTDELLSGLQGDLDTMKTDLAALGTSDALGDLVGEDGIDSEKIADFMLSPTQVETEELYPLNAYGSAMAPLFINLTLWIGVFMLMVIMRIEVDDESVRNLSITQRFFGRWLLLAIMVSLQAIVCCAGCLFIGVQTTNAPAFFLTAVLCSLAYLSIQYTLSTTLQHVGKALCVILVFVQIPGATGLYPIEMTPSFFQAVYPLFPFTYGIGAMRETISGFYDGAWMHDAGILLLFLVVFLAIGALARPYLTNLNHLFARQIEESDIVNGEPVQLPERRFKMAELLRVLADRAEYRSLIAARAARFMRMYPKFKMGAIVVGVLVPVVVTVIFALTETEKVVMLTGWLIWLVVIIAALIVVEFIRDNIRRQASLESMSDEEVRTLYSQRNSVGETCRAEAAHAQEAGWASHVSEKGGRR
ncbi:YhgE/Pip domain-containing protein [Slackia piriformis]|uniref:YhgE/Pip domain-containing protein n=1 Tax=Slackia piriformis TaxID=626934 RepID=UPI0026DABE1D|nr:YhgE/Pip domain-containing protein [Slackia piriformis]MDO5023726.1 YhgE/Pip domain-containing protein [Slackia piriformis]